MAEEQREYAKHQFVPEDYFRELDRREIFADESPLELDIGCGDGGFLLAMAAEHPERRFLGMERLLGRVRKVCRKAHRAGLTNVKVLRLESAYSLECLLPPLAFSRIHLLFPDPWPKRKHHNRRIVRPATLPHYARVLAPLGEFLFKTDDAPYFSDAVEAIESSGLFDRLEWPEDAFFYPLTDFEKHWLALGRQCQRARFVKRS